MLINEVVSFMSQSEKKEFVKYLNHRNKRTDVKNVTLFEAINTQDELAFKKQMNANAYNVLKKRLTDALLDFLALQTLQSEAKEELGVIKQLVVSRRLLSHGQFKLAFKILKSAEAQAHKIGSLSILSEIYHTLIQFSDQPLAPNQEELFVKFESNQAKIIMEERLNLVFAVVKKAFKQKEFESSQIDLTKFIVDNYIKFEISEDVGYSFKNLFKLAQIADIYGSDSRNYAKVDLFFVKYINQLKGTEKDSINDLVYHIDLLYLVSNIYFRKKQFDKSLDFLSDMYVQMQRFNNKYMNDRLIKYVNLLALSLNFKGEYKESITQLKSLVDSRKYNEVELLNPLLALAMVYFQQYNLKAAKEILKTFNQTDYWYEKKMGVDWVFNKTCIEILLHIELGNIDLVDSKIRHLLFRYKIYFQQDASVNVLPFLKLVKQYYHHPEVIEQPEFAAKVEVSLVFKHKKEEDIFFMSFYAWLKAKMEKRAIYEVTLELMN